MGMSTSIYGIRTPDAKWLKMKAVWDACVKAEVAIPLDVGEFFMGEAPDQKGVLINLTDHPAATKLEGDISGFDVDLSLLPKNVNLIRFVNSW